MQVKQPTSVISVFIWIGFVGAISCMEAWLKFRAPGVTLPIGLGIGRLVFFALNKVELVLCFIIVINILLYKEKIFSIGHLSFLIPLGILILQTFWALPTLDARAELHISGQTPQPSNLHFYYVGMEVTKIISLTVYGLSLFKINTIINTSLKITLL